MYNLTQPTQKQTRLFSQLSLRLLHHLHHRLVQDRLAHDSTISPYDGCGVDRSAHAAVFAAKLLPMYSLERDLGAAPGGAPLHALSVLAAVRAAIPLLRYLLRAPLVQAEVGTTMFGTLTHTVGKGVTSLFSALLLPQKVTVTDAFAILDGEFLTPRVITFAGVSLTPV
jgi:hypothetical protein